MKSKKILSINTTKELIHSDEFKKRYKSTPTAFTRNRKLYFPIFMILLLQKSLKSLQLKLNEFYLCLCIIPAYKISEIKEILNTLRIVLCLLVGATVLLLGSTAIGTKKVPHTV